MQRCNDNKVSCYTLLEFVSLEMCRCLLLDSILEWILVMGREVYL